MCVTFHKEKGERWWNTLLFPTKNLCIPIEQWGVRGRFFSVVLFGFLVVVVLLVCWVLKNKCSIEWRVEPRITKSLWLVSEGNMAEKNCFEKWIWFPTQFYIYFRLIPSVLLCCCYSGGAWVELGTGCFPLADFHLLVLMCWVLMCWVLMCQCWCSLAGQQLAEQGHYKQTPARTLSLWLGSLVHRSASFLGISSPCLS